MTPSEIHILFLTWDINFRDSDEGDCYAGEGRRIISTHIDQAVAEAIAADFNPTVAMAEKENTVFPVQKNNRMLKNRFGLTIHDFDGGYNFKLVVETFEISV